MNFILAFIAGAIATLFANITAHYFIQMLDNSATLSNIPLKYRAFGSLAVFLLFFLGVMWFQTRNASPPTPDPTPTSLPTATIPSEACDFTVREIIQERPVVEVNETMLVTITVEDLRGKVATFSWGATLGTLNPSVKSLSNQSTYTAPSQPNDDTITVTIEIDGCSDVVKQASVKILPASTANLESTATLTLPVTPENTATPTPPIIEATSVPIGGTLCVENGTELLTRPWNMSTEGTVGLGDEEANLDPNALNGKDTICITYDLHGLRRVFQTVCWKLPFSVGRDDAKAGYQVSNWSRRSSFSVLTRT